MAEEITSTNRRNLYKIKLETTEGNVIKFVEASNAVSAHQKGLGLAALDDLKVRGADVHRTTKEEVEAFYADSEEEE